MRITQELLLKLTRNEINKRLRQNPDLVAIYLAGSVLTGDPLLGGSTDIDLVFVHKEDPPVSREIARISYEISLDIVHHHQSLYTYHRQLRLNPWLGPSLCTHASILHDTDHWLEFIQSSVSAQFDRPENTYGRAQPFAEKSRAIWFDLQELETPELSAWFPQYLKAIEMAANALATLGGPALTTRRFILELPPRLELLNKSSLFERFLALIGADRLSQEVCTSWNQSWSEAIVAASKQKACPPDLHSARRAYYLQSCNAMLEGGEYQAAIWPMITSWGQAIGVLKDDEKQIDAWHAFCDLLGFQADRFEDCLSGLDSFLDEVEITLEAWKNTYGL